MMILSIGYFVFAMLSMLMLFFNFMSPFHEFLGNVMETISQFIVDFIAWTLRGWADLFQGAR